MENIEKILEFEIISIGQYNLKIISLLAILLIIVVRK